MDTFLDAPEERLKAVLIFRAFPWRGIRRGTAFRAVLQFRACRWRGDSRPARGRDLDARRHSETQRAQARKQSAVPAGRAEAAAERGRGGRLPPAWGTGGRFAPGAGFRPGAFGGFFSRRRAAAAFVPALEVKRVCHGNQHAGIGLFLV